MSSDIEPMEIEQDQHYTTPCLMQRTTEVLTPMPGKSTEPSSRSTLFQDAIDKTLGCSLRSISREEFGECFRGLPGDFVDAIYEAFVLMLSDLQNKCQVELQQVCVEHGIEEQLQSLEHGDKEQQTTSNVAVSPYGDMRTRRAGSRSPYLAEYGGATGPGPLNTAAMQPTEVERIEKAVRLHVLRQEAMALQDLLGRFRITEARRVEALEQRRAEVASLESMYNGAVADLEQIYEMTKLWPTTPQLPCCQD